MDNKALQGADSLEKRNVWSDIAYSGRDMFAAVYHNNGDFNVSGS
tara:strand:+ start:10094 stop:10228 length:135 start_codon:yes stop_codon:yes gene_type:complete